MRNSYESPPPPYNAANHRGHTPAAYTDSERHSLLHHDGERPRTSLSISKLLCFFMLVAIILFSVSFVPCPSTKQTHEKIRREWEAEERAHQLIRDSWNSLAEHQAMVVERGTWQKERADHILEREAIAAEREQWKRERTNHEHRERQKEEEKRALIVWQDLKASTKCLRYGTREYSATLANVPYGMDPLQECWKKNIDIHGRSIFPSRCDTEGVCGAVTGHWNVDFNEASCVTWWRGYDDKGCVEPGIHRYESVLENLQWGDDWHVMCATTPGRVQGKFIDGPTSCASWRSGINGIWLVEDGNCH